MLADGPGLPVPSLGSPDGDTPEDGGPDGAWDEDDPTATGAGVGPELPFSRPAPTPSAMPTASTTTTRTPATVQFTRRIPAEELAAALRKSPAAPLADATRARYRPHGPIRSGRRIAELTTPCVLARLRGRRRSRAGPGRERPMRVGVGSARDSPVTRGARGQADARRHAVHAEAPRKRAPKAAPPELVPVMAPEPDTDPDAPAGGDVATAAADAVDATPVQAEPAAAAAADAPDPAAAPPASRAGAGKPSSDPSASAGAPDGVLRIERGGIGQATAGSVEVHLGGIGGARRRGGVRRVGRRGRRPGGAAERRVRQCRGVARGRGAG